jgi:hypothetical protein
MNARRPYGLAPPFSLPTLTSVANFTFWIPAGLRSEVEPNRIYL